jgi:hypothetical protein
MIYSKNIDNQKKKKITLYSQQSLLMWNYRIVL